MRACLLLRTVCRSGCCSGCEPSESAVSRAGCLPCPEGVWLECRFIRPGRIELGGGLGEDEATAADGMAAGVGWDVEALGMAAVVVMGRGSSSNQWCSVADSGFTNSRSSIALRRVYV
jgi:hypothetical protein